MSEEEGKKIPGPSEEAYPKSVMHQLIEKRMSDLEKQMTEQEKKRKDAASAIDAIAGAYQDCIYWLESLGIVKKEQTVQATPQPAKDTVTKVEKVSLEEMVAAIQKEENKEASNGKTA